VQLPGAIAKFGASMNKRVFPIFPGFGLLAFLAMDKSMFHQYSPCGHGISLAWF